MIGGRGTGIQYTKIKFKIEHVEVLTLWVPSKKLQTNGYK